MNAIELSDETIRNLRKYLWNEEYDDDESRKILILSDQELVEYYLDRYINPHLYCTDEYFDKQIEEAHEYYASAEEEAAK